MFAVPARESPRTAVLLCVRRITGAWVPFLRVLERTWREVLRGLWAPPRCFRVPRSTWPRGSSPPKERSKVNGSSHRFVCRPEGLHGADDVAGFGARAKKVEQVSQSTSVAQALPLFARLMLRRPRDKGSTYFHDHLSTPTRATALADSSKSPSWEVTVGEEPVV